MGDPKYFFVFDVESVGLHGEGFAVGFVVIDATTGAELDSGLFASHEDASPGLPNDRSWVGQHVTPALDAHVRGRCIGNGLAAVSDVRRLFWDVWSRWRAKGETWMTADVPWPCEARFLAACIDEDRRRAAFAPYPLIDIASVRLAAGLDPLASEERLDDEKPAHNPLADARQSARLLVEALKVSHA